MVDFNSLVSQLKSWVAKPKNEIVTVPIGPLPDQIAEMDAQESERKADRDFNRLLRTDPTKAYLNHPERITVDHRQLALTVFRDHRELMIPRFTAWMNDRSNPLWAAGAMWIFLLGEQEQVIRFLQHVWHTGVQRERDVILHYLEYCDEIRNYADWRSFFEQSLESPEEDIVLDAHFAFRRLAMQTSNRRILDLLQRESLPQRDRFVAWLGANDPEPIHLDILGRYLNEHSDPEKYVFTLSSLIDLAQVKDMTMSNGARRVLQDWLRQPDRRERDVGNLYWASLAEAVAKHVEHRDLHWMKEFLDHHGETSHSGPKVFKAFAMLSEDPEQTILNALDKPSLREIAAKTVAELYKGTRHAGFRAKLEELVEYDVTSRALPAIHRALRALDGNSKSKAKEDVANGLQGEEKMNAIWAANGWNLENAKETVIASGILNAEQYDQAVTAWMNNPDFDEELAAPLIELLCAANVAITCFGDVDQTPSPHDELIFDFARVSQGKFRPTNVAQDWENDSPDSKLLLTFTCSGKEYRQVFADLRNCFNLGPVLEIVHEALADAGVMERFIPLDLDDREVFLFTTAAIAKKLAKSLYLPISPKSKRIKKSN